MDQVNPLRVGQYKNMYSESTHWYLNIGYQYHTAARRLAGSYRVFTDSWQEPVQMPTFYCFAFAAELYLKGYLDNKKIFFPKNNSGHNLKLLMSLGDAISFYEIDKVDQEQINRLNEGYFLSPNFGKYDLRYPKKSGERIYPHPDAMNLLLNKMYSKLQGHLAGNMERIK